MTTKTKPPVDRCADGAAHHWQLGTRRAITGETPARCAKCGAEKTFGDETGNRWRRSMGGRPVR